MEWMKTMNELYCGNCNAQLLEQPLHGDSCGNCGSVFVEEGTPASSGVGSLMVMAAVGAAIWWFLADDPNDGVLTLKEAKEVCTLESDKIYENLGYSVGSTYSNSQVYDAGSGTVQLGKKLALEDGGTQVQHVVVGCYFEDNELKTVGWNNPANYKQYTKTF